MRVTEIRVTPVAIKDAPLLNVWGIHEPYALRAIIEVVTDDGLTGLGETYGDEPHLSMLRAAATELVGLDPFSLNELRRAIDRLTTAPDTSPAEQQRSVSVQRTAACLTAAFEMAFLDVQGKATGRRVVDLLGGPCRDAVPYSAYLFYKNAAHQTDPGFPEQYGQALTSSEIVEQARAIIGKYGFRSIKLKGGVFPPDQEAAAIEALYEAFPGYPLRLDPNGGWSVETSIQVAERLGSKLEYLEDPTLTIDGMAQVAAAVEVPLATNMCVIQFSHVPESIAKNAVQVILSDPHFWGGLRASQRLAGVCETFELGLSMHSNSHLGISLAAMTHLAAATPNLTYACDTHTPWQSEDVVQPGALRFVEGSVPVPDGPGLGVELDRDALARMAEQYEKCGITKRDDQGAMRKIDPDWNPTLPKW